MPMPRTLYPFLLPLLLGGCASQMPPVSGFFAGHPYQADLLFAGTVCTREEFAVDDSRYLCQEATVKGQAVLRCSETPGWRLYQESMVRLGAQFHAGDTWRVGLGGPNPGLQAGWRDGHLGAMAWVAPVFGNSWSDVDGALGGIAAAQRFSPVPQLSLGIFESLGRTAYLEGWRQDPTMPLRHLSYDELSLGGWIGARTPFQATLEARIGRELRRDAWRLHLALTCGYGGKP